MIAEPVRVALKQGGGGAAAQWDPDKPAGVG
jgi:hypothetical protein